MTFRRLLRSKIHRAVVTHADLNYQGSITLSPELLQAADIKEYEAVNVWNITRGTRFETYTIKGEPGTSDICVNGAAAHLVEPGDLIIIACFMFLEEKKVKHHKPKIIFVDQKNRITGIGSEIPGPALNNAA